MPTSLSVSAARRRASGRRHAAQLQRQGHVLLGRERRQQVERLEDESHPLAADDRALVVVERGQIDAFQQHLAAAGRFHAAEDVQQRALARARRAHDRQQFALADLEVDAAQGVNAHLALGPVVFLQAAGFEHVHGQSLGGGGGATQSLRSGSSTAFEVLPQMPLWPPRRDFSNKGHRRATIAVRVARRRGTHWLFIILLLQLPGKPLLHRVGGMSHVPQCLRTGP